MSENKVEQLRDEGSRMQVVAAGAIAGLVSRYALEPHTSLLSTQSLINTLRQVLHSSTRCRQDPSTIAESLAL